MTLRLMDSTTMASTIRYSCFRLAPLRLISSLLSLRCDTLVCGGSFTTSPSCRCQVSPKQCTRHRVLRATIIGAVDPGGERAGYRRRVGPFSLHLVPAPALLDAGEAGPRRPRQTWLRRIHGRQGS